MTKFRTQTARESLLRRVRRQRLKYITILPSLITILNGVCGFAAIVFAASPSAVHYGALTAGVHIPYFALAGYMVLFAMIADMLDGRLARMSKSTSSFGGQLDSVCDVISFGVAPAFLVLKVLEYKLLTDGFGPLEATVLGTALRRFVWLAAAVYVSCAAIRLARFNVENEEDESAHMSFVGLPTPAAAGVLVSLVIFHQESLMGFSVASNGLSAVFKSAVIYLLPFLAIAVAILMVSRIRYPHILNQYIRGKKPFAHFIRVLLFLGLIIWSRQTALVLIFCGFAAGSFAKWFYMKFIRRHIGVVESGQAAGLQIL